MLQYGNVASSEFSLTDDAVYSMYLRGEISYWDYTFIYMLINDHSIQAARDYAKTYAEPGDVSTVKGKEVAAQVLVEHGRGDEVSQLDSVFPKAAFNWKTWLPVGLGAVAVVLVVSQTRRS